jgi:hypothetical protein
MLRFNDLAKRRLALHRRPSTNYNYYMSGTEDGEAEDASTQLVSMIASIPEELTAEAMVQVGQFEYQTGYQTGQGKGLLWGALIGATLIVIFK